MITAIRTIDAHTAGEPLRLIVDGFPPVPGASMLEKRDWVREHCDHLRTALMLEPRGHADMYGAIFTEPEHAHADAGVLFMHNEGYSTMCGHGIIAVATIALERGLIVPRDPGAIVLDTPAGPVRARAILGQEAAAGFGTVEPEHRPNAGRGGQGRATRVSRVAFSNVPSFVLHPAVPVTLGSRTVHADVAFGGAFYAIVDSEAAGIPVLPARLPELRRAGMEIKAAVEAAVRVVHPEEPRLGGIYGTIFTGPAGEGADLRNVTIFADAEVDRSPCGTGTCAVMAVLAGMGLLGPDHPFVHESVIGTRFTGRVVRETLVAEIEAIVPEIEGEAWITGEHTFLIDDRDPLRQGFRL